jgi:glycosyltransferase involved in cell wall biosynthesis
MKLNPLVSIVLPTYNRSHFIEQSIQSCINQTYSNWELIIVDDASTDETPNIIKQYKSRDRRVKSVRHTKNRKLPAALNSGFCEAKGKYYTWVADDDNYKPYALSTLVKYLENNSDVDIVYSGLTMVDENGKKICYRQAAPSAELTCQNVVGLSFLYHNYVHKKINGFDENTFMIEDYDFWLRAAKHFSFAAINKSLHNHRWHKNSLSLSKKEEIENLHIKTVSKHLPTLKKLSYKAISSGYWNLAEVYFYRKNLTIKAISNYIKSIKTQPSRLLKKRTWKFPASIIKTKLFKGNF